MMNEMKNEAIRRLEMLVKEGVDPQALELYKNGSLMICEFMEDGTPCSYHLEQASPVVRGLIQEMKTYGRFCNLKEDFFEPYYIVITRMDDGYTLYFMSVSPYPELWNMAQAELSECHAYCPIYYSRLRYTYFDRMVFNIEDGCICVG